MIRAIVVVVLIYVLGVLTMLPARLLTWLPIPDNVRLQSLSGTLWHGHAEALFINGLPAYGVDWSLSPWKLFTGRAELDVDLGKARNSVASGQGTIGWSFSGIYAENVALTIPAQVVVQRLPLPVPIEVAGQLHLSLIEATEGKPLCGALQGQLRWADGLLNNQYMKAMSFKQLEVPIHCDKGAVVASLQTQQLPLAMNIQLRVDDKTAAFSGTVRPQQGLSKDVVQGLSLFTKPQQNGEYLVDWSLPL